MGILTLSKWIMDSDAFGRGSDLGGSGWIPGPQIWNLPHLVVVVGLVGGAVHGVRGGPLDAQNLLDLLPPGAYTRSDFSST